MLKTILFVLSVLTGIQVFSQTATSQFTDPAGNYSTTQSGICFGCSFSNTARVADMDPGNHATIIISAGLSVSRGIRAKLNSLSPGNTYAGFYVNIGSVVSALPSVTISTYKSGSLRQTVITNGNIVTLMGGAAGYVSALTNSLDYDEIGISLNGGIATVGMTAQVYYAIGGLSSPPLFILPVKFTSIAVTEKDKLPYLTWSAAEEGNTVYEIQRSGDGIHFTTIAQQRSNTNTGNNTFSFTDHTAPGKLLYYRISTKAEIGSATIFSKTVTISLPNFKESLRVFPNPVTNGSFTIYTETPAGETIVLRMTDNAGRIIYTDQLTSNNKMIRVEPGKNMPAGLYFITLQSGNSLSKSLPLLIQ